MAEKEAVKAAKMYLERRGYEVLGEVEGANDMLVARDENGVTALIGVFLKDAPDMGRKATMETGFSREDFEAAMVTWFLEHPGQEVGEVRFDEMSIMPIGQEKALLRYKKGCFRVDADGE